MRQSSSPSIGSGGSPGFLFISLAAAGALSLSVHVVMLQVLGIPFPEENAPKWAALVNLTGTTLALILVQKLTTERLGGFWRTALVSGLILFMIKEGLRAAVMGGVVTGGWIFALAGSLVPILLSFGIALICMVASRVVDRPLGILVAALISGGLAMAFQVLVGLLVSPIMNALAPFARPDAYQLPYPVEVLVPAYLTFVEPVIGCAILIALIWPRLRGRAFARIIQVTLLVILLKGVVFRTLLYPAFMAQPFAFGMLSQSQFLLEFAMLGGLSAVAWHFFGRGANLPMM